MDMLHHLTGRQIPGVGLCQTFSTDLDQRTNQLLQQHKAMLDFLRWDLYLCYSNDRIGPNKALITRTLSPDTSKNDGSLVAQV